MTDHRYEVLLTHGAEQDLEALYDYLAVHDGPEAADRVLDQILAVAERLAELPERGNCPPELATLGIREYRQVYFKPWRLIYRVCGEQVHILLIANGRRDMASLLMRRLLTAAS